MSHGAGARPNRRNRELPVRLRDGRNQVLEFAPGETRHTIILQTVGDDDFEPNEDFYLVLDYVYGAIPDKESLRLTLFNDDPAPAAGEMEASWLALGLGMN